SGWLATAERGLPGPVTNLPVGERQWDEQARLWASDERHGSRTRLRLAGGLHAARIRYLNPQLELDETGRTDAYFAEGTFHYAGDRFQLTAGASAEYTQAWHPSRRDAHVAHGA